MIIMLNQMDDGEDAYRQSHQPLSQTYVVATTLSFSIHTVCQFDTCLVMSILNARRRRWVSYGRLSGSKHLVVHNKISGIRSAI